MGACWTACFSVPENTRHPSLAQLPEPKETNETSSNEGVTKNANRQNLGHLTQKKDYSTAIAANKALENNNSIKRNNDNDMDVVYEDDGTTIKTTSNGITVNEYGNRRYVADSATNAEVLDDILIT